MAKPPLNLSHVLCSLETDLKETVDALCAPIAPTPFEEAVNAFITKYPAPHTYDSLEALLAASASSTSDFKGKDLPLKDALETLLP